MSTAEGLRPIQTIREGNLVWAADPDTGEVRLQPVVKTMKHMVSSLRLLNVGGETIRTTDIHPFWVEQRGWTRAEHLTAGDTLRSKDGSRLALLASRLVSTNGATASSESGFIKASTSNLKPLSQLEGAFPVYNLEVGGFHTFFVSKAQILVHNK